MKKSTYVDFIAREIDKNNFSSPKESLIEKKYHKDLTKAGKKASIDEYFGTPLEVQEISPIGPFKNPRETSAFNNAYRTTTVQLNNNIIPGDMKDYYESLCATASQKHR